MTLEIPLWGIFLVFFLGMLPGIFVGCFFCSLSRLGPPPQTQTKPLSS